MQVAMKWIWMKMMNKKLLIAGLFISLAGFTTMFSHRQNNQLEIDNPIFQEQQLIVPADYAILGGPRWLEVIAQADRHLDDLYEAWNQAEDEVWSQIEYEEWSQVEDENFIIAQSAYGQGLESYFALINKDIRVIAYFFEFADRLSQDHQEAIARRLVKVISEHEIFLTMPPHSTNLTDLLGYPEEVLHEVSNRAAILRNDLEAILPDEADEADDIMDSD